MERLSEAEIKKMFEEMDLGSEAAREKFRKLEQYGEKEKPGDRCVIVRLDNTTEGDEALQDERKLA